MLVTCFNGKRAFTTFTYIYTIMKLKDTFFSKKQTLNCRGRLIELSTPRVMGVLNTTPDSFFDGGRYTAHESIYNRVQQVITEGADFIDIGAYSSRPGADDIAVNDEVNRLEPALKIVKKYFPDTLVSIDTFRSEVVKWAHSNYGIDMVNDISGGRLDTNMYNTMADNGLPYCVMHMPGTPKSMQQQTDYKHLLKDILCYFAEITWQLKKLGLNDIIIDPGFGFGKTLDQNYRLLSSLDDFKIFQLPLLVGVSRKSMIYKLLGTTANDALTGTISLNTLALSKGADILRVHDVKEAVETVKLYKKCLEMEQRN